MIEVVAALRFGKGGNGNACLRDGWSAPEDGFVWALGPQSTLDLALPPAPGRIFLELTVQPFVRAPLVPAQRFDIVANGHTISRRRLSWFATLRVEIPAAAAQDGQLLLSFHHPDAVAPASLGADGDGRALAVQLHALTLLRFPPRDMPPAPAGPLHMAADYRFGGNETTGDLLLDGWAEPEIDYVWSIGPRSTLRIPIERPDMPHTLLLDVQPFLAPPTLPRQRVAIGVDGHLLEFVSLRQRSCLGYTLPPLQQGSREVTISFDNLDAVTPRAPGAAIDARPLALMLCGVRVLRGAPPAPAAPATRAALAGRLHDGSLQDAVAHVTGQHPRDVVAGFEPLGNACEFSHLQRRLGWDPAGLLRFLGVLTPQLVDGIINGFWGLGRLDRLQAAPRSDGDPGYFIREGLYQMTLHTVISADLIDEAAVLQQLARALPLLIRKFFDDAVRADKIFVLQRRDGVTRPEAEAALAALRLWGDATLLWVTVDAELAGTAGRLGARLLRGYVCDAAGPGGREGESESWLSMLANAWVLQAGRG